MNLSLKISIFEQFDFSKIHSSTIADVLDSFGVWGVLDPAIVPLNEGAVPVVGFAYTVRWKPVRKSGNIMAPQPSTWDQVKNFLAPDVEQGKGQIYVGGVDDGLLRTLALAGGFSATDFEKRGFEAMILGGAIRDAHIVKNTQLPIWGTNFTPADTQGNYEVSEVGGACRVGGLDVHTGDLIVADATGVTVIPKDMITDVLTRAQYIENVEVNLQKRIDSGVSLMDAVQTEGRL